MVDDTQKTEFSTEEKILAHEFWVVPKIRLKKWGRWT